MFIERSNYLEKLKPFINKDFIKILVGVRRSGKSIILSQITDYLISEKIAKPSEVLRINFEDPEYIDIKTLEDFISLYKETIDNHGYKYLLFDEPQRIKDWDQAINSIYSTKKYDIYITGSSSKLLARELSTYLTGRYINIRVNTLTFSEFLEFRKAYANIEKPDLQEEFNYYLLTGGFPALSTYDAIPSTDTIKTTITDIYNSVVLRDIIERHNVRNTELLTRVIKFIFDNIGNTFSAKSISDFLKSDNRNLNQETIYNYISWLEEAMIIERVSRYDIRGKSLLKFQEKFYLSDISLLYAIGNIRESQIPGVLENLIHHELIAHGYTVSIGKNEDREIDFIAEKPNQKIYLQVCQELKSQKTIDREFSAFDEINDNYPKFILTLDNTNFPEKINGIPQYSISDFLINILPNL